MVSPFGEGRATIRHTINMLASGGPRPLRMGYLYHEKPQKSAVSGTF